MWIRTVTFHYVEMKPITTKRSILHSDSGNAYYRLPTLHVYVTTSRVIRLTSTAEWDIHTAFYYPVLIVARVSVVSGNHNQGRRDWLIIRNIENF